MMLKRPLLSLLLISSFLFVHAAEIINNELPIVVVVASYNNVRWCEKNLETILAQKYSNYRVVYVDDCSTDGMSDRVVSYVQQNDHVGRVQYMRNSQRCGALRNYYHAIHACDNNEIVVIVDGDDHLAHDQVLAYLNSVYADGSVWLTYGQYREQFSGTIGFSVPMPDHVAANNTFRYFNHIPSHLRTFYAGLFKKIKKEDLMKDGEFFSMTGDMATMIPMIEMARDHFRFIPHVLYVYNDGNSISDHRINKRLQRDIDLIIRSLPRYAKLASPFND